MEHCDILRYEFILSKPCQQIEHLLEDTLVRLSDQALLRVEEPVSKCIVLSKQQHVLSSYILQCVFNSKSILSL